MKRLLVLGASGAIGAAVANDAVSAGWEVSAGVRDRQSYTRRPLAKCVSLHTCDLSRLDEVRSLVGAVMPDLVVMAAFPPGHPCTPDERRSSLTDNLAIHLAVCEAMAAVADRCRLVSLGSSTAYGKGNETRDPRGVMAPNTFRGAVKAAESLAVSTMARLHQFPCTELRIFCAYGPWMSHDRVLTRLLKAALTSTRVPLSACAAASRLGPSRGHRSRLPVGRGDRHPRTDRLQPVLRAAERCPRGREHVGSHHGPRADRGESLPGPRSTRRGDARDAAGRRTRILVATAHRARSRNRGVLALGPNRVGASLPLG